jgi:phage-related protein
MGILIKFAVAFFLLIFIFKALKLDKVLKGIWDTIVIMVKAVIYGVGKVIEGVGNIIGGIIDVYNSIGTLVEEGKIRPLFEALWRIGKGVLQILFGIVWTVIGPILEYYVGFFKYTLGGWLTSFYTDSMETLITSP